MNNIVEHPSFLHVSTILWKLRRKLEIIIDLIELREIISIKYKTNNGVFPKLPLNKLSKLAKKNLPLTKTLGVEPRP